jgi:hypothetical protein
MEIDIQLFYSKLAEVTRRCLGNKMSPQFLLMAVVSPPEQQKKSCRRAAHKNKKTQNKIEIENYSLIRDLIEFKHFLSPLGSP